MEGIPIYYVTQPSTDDSLNVFFLPPSYKSQADVKIKDVVANFPHKDSGRFFHYRFYAICDKDQKTWVDISNMSAKAPIVDNRILVKVLEIEKPHYSKLFATVSKATREEPVSQQQQQQQPQPEPRIQSQASRSDSMNTSGTRQNRANTAQERQQPPVNVTSPPKTQTQTQAQVKPPVQVKSPPVSSAAHYEDLLGGDHSSNTYTQTTVTATTTRVTFGSPQGDTRVQDDSEVTKNMTREELTAYKANKMNQAIQDKLAFANQIWADENKNQEEKEKAYNELEDNIKKWAGKNGQRNNIRALLCTLHEVAWPESGWAPLSLTSLMMPNQIKVNFFKALTKFHPDKNSSGDYRQRYIAERVTNELNAAWDEFRKTNP